LSFDSDTKTSSVRLWKNEGSTTSESVIESYGGFWLDDSTNETWLGSIEISADTFADTLKGFMYKMIIENRALMTTSPYYKFGACDSSCSTTCTDQTTECLDDYLFTEYADGSPCGSDCNTNKIGCRRS
jgi:hypothetical protein